jgi:hypothetical protein
LEKVIQFVYLGAGIDDFVTADFITLDFVVRDFISSNGIPATGMDRYFVY